MKGRFFGACFFIWAQKRSHCSIDDYSSILQQPRLLSMYRTTLIIFTDFLSLCLLKYSFYFLLQSSLKSYLDFLFNKHLFYSLYKLYLYLSRSLKNGLIEYAIKPLIFLCCCSVILLLFLLLYISNIN